MSRLPIGYTVRLALVRKVGRTYLDCEFFDRFGEKPFRCPIPHPYAGRGGGIFAGIEPETIVLVAAGTQEKWYVVGFIPDINFFGDIDGGQNINYDETSYPDINPGELIFKGNQSQTINFLNDGSLGLDAGIGTAATDIELSPFSQGLFLRVNNFYKFTEAGRTTEGVIKRDLNLQENPDDTNSTDFLTGTTYDAFLSGLGRSPQNEVHYRTTQLAKSVIRNPSLTEKRDLIYEFGDSFDVQYFNAELQALNETDPNDPSNNISALQSDPSFRKNRRTDILNLTGRNYNHLIEEVRGTLIDIYGNVLDINRNIVPIPESNSVNIKGTGNSDGLATIYKYHRRGIKYHFEINSHKPEDLGEISIGASNDNHLSKWNIDIDGEGLTKINIPASSETGNIPVLGRFVNSVDPNNPDSGSFKDKQRRDVWLDQFGASKIRDDGTIDPIQFAGQAITDTTYIPGTIQDLQKREDNQGIQAPQVTVGTAYHDLFNIANLIFTVGKLKSSDPNNSSKSVPPVATSINNHIYGRDEQIPAGQEPNAGGRSLQMNLDGSLEASIGADTVDRKSLVLDTAGGTISHFGRDRNGRSVIHQSDGDIIIQVGGKGILNDGRFQGVGDVEDRPGRLEIHLNRPGATPQKIVIDEDGLTIDVQGSTAIVSSGDLVLSAGGSLLLNSELIYKYGSFDKDTRTFTDAELLEKRKGYPV
jgi:hypothetical protein